MWLGSFDLVAEGRPSCKGQANNARQVAGRISHRSGPIAWARCCAKMFTAGHGIGNGEPNKFPRQASRRGEQAADGFLGPGRTEPGIAAVLDGRRNHGAAAIMPHVHADRGRRVGRSCAPPRF